MTHPTDRNAVVDLDRPLSWFRFESEFPTDPRIGGLTDTAIAVYVFAMCATARRIAPCSDEKFAWWIHRKLSRIKSIKRQLIERGLISDEWVPEFWERNQPPIDRTNAERQARHRKKKQLLGTAGEESDRYFPQVPYDDSTQIPAKPPPAADTPTSNAVSNALVTPAQERRGQDRTGQNRTEQERQPEALQQSSASALGLASPILNSKALLPDPFPGGSAKDGRRKTEDFEAINDRVAKLINDGGLAPDDLAGIARTAQITEKQARASIRQLRDRRRLTH